jgi:hypothetical protein
VKHRTLAIPIQSVAGFFEHFWTTVDGLLSLASVERPTREAGSGRNTIEGGAGISFWETLRHARTRGCRMGAWSLPLADCHF